ncbi:MAG: hypothetical protein HZB81_04700 [Deltaproteobacteria bacterium]|nr:hypothetical protein [Deltaproteobacteria bacterium]
MSASIPIELYESLEDKYGKDLARDITKTIEISFEAIEKKADAIALQKKLEIKDELTKELASKADILLLRQELETVKTELEAKIENGLLKLDRKFTIMFIILFFTIIFVNRDALEFMAKVLGLIK